MTDPIISKKEEESSNNPGFLIDNEMKNVNLQYDDLKALDPNTDYIAAFQKLKSILSNPKITDWTQQVGAINFIRKLFKYERKMFYQAFYGLKLYPKIIDLISSIRSSLAKITFVFIREVLTEPSGGPQNEEAPEERKKGETDSSTQIIDVIKLLIPCLITKASSNQSFIKKDANECLELIISKTDFVQSLFIFIEQLKVPQRKQQDIDLTCSLINKYIRKLGKDNLTNNIQQFPHFYDMIKNLCTFYDWKKNTNEKKFREVLETFIEVMTKEEFDKKIERCGKKEKDVVKKILEKKSEALKKKNKNIDIKRPKSISRVNLNKVFKESKNIKNNTKANFANADGKVNTPNIQKIQIKAKRSLSIKNEGNEQVSKENQIIN